MRQPPGDADSVVGEPGHDLNYDESIVYNVSACVLLRVLRVDVQAKERRDPAALPRRVPHALKHKEKHPCVCRHVYRSTSFMMSMDNHTPRSSSRPVNRARRPILCAFPSQHIRMHAD
jgi:hypothetical protein